MRRILTLLLLALASSYASAQGVFIGSYPNASTLIGTERIPIDQSNAVVNATPQQLGQYFANAITGDITINSSFVATVTAINGLAIPALVASECLQSNSAATAWVMGTCGSGGGGTPGGSAFSIQYNQSGTFNGILPSGAGVWCIQYGSLSAAPSLAACPGGGAPTFDQIGTGTNTTAAMTVSTGSSLSHTGTGSIDANYTNGLQIAANMGVAGTPGVMITNTSAQITTQNWLALPQLTYAGLTTALTCNSTNQGVVAFVKDANVAPGNAITAGGGTNKVIALCDGTNWVAH